MKIERKMRHAWFSEKAMCLWGGSVYQDASGNEVLVTFVDEKRDAGEQYFWEDKRYVGEVCEWCRKVDGASLFGRMLMGVEASFVGYMPDRPVS